MPFIIAGLLHLFFVVVGVGLAFALRSLVEWKFESLCRAVFGSVAGFLVGVVVALVAGSLWPMTSANVGATLIVVPLTFLTAGMGAIVALWFPRVRT